MKELSIHDLEKKVDELEEEIKRRKRRRESEKTDVSRSRGVLSTTDREYLIGDEECEYSRQAAYNRREAITDRTHQAVKDMSLLNDIWPVSGVEVSLSDEEIDGAIAFLESIKEE